ncbi:hypothetical protein TNCV_1113711 [Trichonephila clavipes]|nr:hypothetical protein TNCV_1113711 [Trichonephila clavipes]
MAFTVQKNDSNTVTIESDNGQIQVKSLDSTRRFCSSALVIASHRRPQALGRSPAQSFYSSLCLPRYPRTALSDRWRFLFGIAVIKEYRGGIR